MYKQLEIGTISYFCIFALQISLKSIIVNTLVRYVQRIASQVFFKRFANFFTLLDSFYITHAHFVIQSDPSLRYCIQRS